MDKLEASIKDKLERYQLTPFEALDKKTQERLLQTEKAIEEIETKSKMLYEQLKKIKLNRLLIVNSEYIGFSRKTSYNDEILNRYIENSINDSEDYFNEMQVNKLSEDLSELKELNDNIISNIINTLILENELNKIKDTVESLKIRNDKLLSIIKEKEGIIRNLQKGNNVVPFKKE